MKLFGTNLTISILSRLCVMLLFVFLIAGEVGYMSFSKLLFNQYSENATNIANTAVTLISGSNIDYYLQTSGQSKNYKQDLEDIQNLCNTQAVTLIYVIVPDKDYEYITNVFNTVNHNYNYERWEIGYRRATTNNEYKKAYKQIYEEGVKSATVIRDKNFGETGSHITALVPITYKGRVVGIMCVEKPMAELDAVKNRFLFSLSAIFLGLFGVFSLSYGLFLHRRILRPLNVITKETQRFAKYTTAPERPLGELIKNRDEIGTLAKSIDKMTDNTLENLKRITEETKQRQSTETELEVARRIQYGIVPEKTALQKDGIDIYAISNPAKTVGGDFYDCFHTNDGKICAVVGDVSGKGIAAALFMAITKTLIRESMGRDLDPATALNTVNERLCSQNPEAMFVTVFLCLFDSKTGVLTYANAGHTKPVIIGDEVFFKDIDSGIALGLFESADIENSDMVLNKGQGIFLYTDGATEAVNIDRQFSGEATILKALKGAKNSQEAVENVKKEIANFTLGCDQFDDLTLLSLFFSSKEKKILKPEFSSFSQVKDTIDTLGDDKEKNMMIKLACEEIFTNIISYSGAKNIVFECEKTDDAILISFEDDGREFDPIAEKNTIHDFDDLDRGGMGIMMVKQIAKSLEYKYSDKKNKLKMKF